MNKHLLLLLVLFTLFLFRLQAQTQLTDFHYQPGDKSSILSGFVTFNNLVFFEATTENEGREIWVTDGNDTHILKDIYPGNGSGISTSLSESSVILNDQLFFIANDGENGNQLWSSDGTEAGTKRITSLANLNSSKLTFAGNYIFFLVKESELLQVWRSDGTASGTILLQKDLPIWNTPTFEGEANNLFFFTFQPKGSNNSRVWRSDGSATGTFPITEELDGSVVSLNGPAAPTQYIEFKNELYFVVRSMSLFPYPTSVGIVKTDGSVKNTVPIKAVHEATELLNFVDVIDINNKLYFSFYDEDYFRLFIWESDGTEAETKKIYDESGTKYYAISNLSSDGNNLIFMGKSSRSETALLKLKLDTYQVEEVKEIAANAEKPFIYTDFSIFQINQITANRFAFFTPFFPVQIWTTDLIPANTIPLTNLKDVRREIITFNEKVYFPAYSEGEGFELWKSDINFSNAQLFSNINQSRYGLGNTRSVLLDDKLFFTADDGIHGLELWVYNKATNEKHLVKDIWAGNKSAEPRQLIYFNNEIYFVANTEEHGSQIWRSDGTKEGTIKISSLNEISKYSYINQLLHTQDKIYFSARVNDYYVLYGSDGTQTELIRTFKEVNYTSMKEIIAAGKYVYFIIEGGGEDLWRSDGTRNGTSKIKDLYAVNNLAAVNDKVYFSATEGIQDEYELWQSNGTAVGTTMVKNIGEGYSSYPEQLVSFNGFLVFTATTREFGREYWKTDGTAEGTVQIADIYPGPATSTFNAISSFNSAYTPIPGNYAISNGFLYFSANDGSHGTELWRTDGTTSGTILVKDINQGASGSFPKHFADNKGKIYFSPFSAESGTELWVTEGTTATTRQLFDLNSGLPGSSPTNFTFLDEELFFVAEKNNSGRQLWRYAVDKVTGLKELSESKTFTLYPNPTTNYLFIQKGNSKLQNWKIYNLQGQEFPIDKDSSDKIYVGNLTLGIYLLVAKVDNKLVVRKFIKK